MSDDLTARVTARLTDEVLEAIHNSAEVAADHAYHGDTEPPFDRDQRDLARLAAWRAGFMAVAAPELQDAERRLREAEARHDALKSWLLLHRNEPSRPTERIVGFDMALAELERLERQEATNGNS